MVLLGIVCFALAVGLAVMAFKPRKTWWAMSAWAYRRPEAAEPSDTRYALSALGYGVAALVMFGSGIYALTEGRANERSLERADELQEECEAILDELEDVFTDVDRLGPVRARARELGVRIEIEPVSVTVSNPEWARMVKVMQGDELFGYLAPIPRRECASLDP